MSRPEVLEHIDSLFNFPINETNVRKFAAKIRKLEIARLLRGQLKDAGDKLLGLDGNESISHILGIAEDSIFDFSSLLNDVDNEPKRLGDGLVDYVQHLSDNPIDQIGIPTGFPEYDKAIGGGLRNGTINVIGARPKALRYGSKVYTPSGPVNIEDIKIGDKVFHPFKGITNVTEVHDHKGIDIYRIHFRDGDYVDCCKDHLWHVYKRYPYDKIKNKTAEIKTTLNLINDIKIGMQPEYKWDIPLPNCVNYKTQDTPIDPYVLGVLLGDGSIIKDCRYTSMDEEIIKYMNNYFKTNGYDVKFDSKKSKATTYRINGFQAELRNLNIFGCNCYSKFIPKSYIYNNSNVRIQILQGLLDTDGDCTIDKRSKQSRSRFCSVSYQLCLDVKEIVHSLGGLCSIKQQVTKCNDKSFNSYRCEIRLPENIVPFKLSRKKDKFTNRSLGELKRTIVKIEKIDTDNARCITLSENDGLFMTDNYVVTHNCGKTTLSGCMGFRIAAQQNIPVLNMDTEMTFKDHVHKTLAMASDCFIYDIETGKFAQKPQFNAKVKEVARKIQEQNVPYDHRSIAGMPFEEQLAIMRRWIIKKVGVDSEGKAKPCVIVYDYLKLMTSAGIGSNMAEFQALGFMMSSLHNFAVRYGIPILTFMQLNRDGINKEGTDVASGSDRIVWLCSNFTIFKIKSDEEIAQDGIETGNRKLVPVVCRHGAGMEDGNYINCYMKGSTAKITEGKTKFQLMNEKPKIELDE